MLLVWNPRRSVQSQNTQKAGCQEGGINRQPKNVTWVIAHLLSILANDLQNPTAQMNKQHNEVKELSNHGSIIKALWNIHTITVDNHHLRWKNRKMTRPFVTSQSNGLTKQCVIDPLLKRKVESDTSKLWQILVNGVEPGMIQQTLSICSVIGIHLEYFWKKIKSILWDLA